MPKQNELYKCLSNGRVFYIDAVFPETNEVYTRSVATGRRTTLKLDRLEDRNRFKKIKDDYRWL